MGKIYGHKLYINKSYWKIVFQMSKLINCHAFHFSYLFGLLCPSWFHFFFLSGHNPSSLCADMLSVPINSLPQLFPPLYPLSKAWITDRWTIYLLFTISAADTGLSVQLFINIQAFWWSPLYVYLILIQASCDSDSSWLLLQNWLFFSNF